jgi:cellulose synthase/poly-beta-1,6-N-acetylglucosamine synthase-like glycosyltransferase
VLIFEAAAFIVFWFLASITYLIHGAYLVFSFFSINAKLNSRVWMTPPLADDIPLCLIIPLYEEDVDSVAKTFTSLSEQDYPHDLARMIIAVEEDDDSTLKAVQDEVFILKEAGFEAQIVAKPPPRSTKAAAINYVLAQAIEPVVGIYDGGDVVLDKEQFRRAVALLATGCDGVGVKVIRGGNGTLSRFSLADTTMWCDVTLPALTYLLRSPLLSGEGLFLKRVALEAVGGFPESLTEDSHLTLLFAQKGLKMSLLDSIVYEGAPANFNALAKQKMRWHRGTSLCARETLTGKLPIRRRAALVLAYSAPIVLIAIALSFLVLALNIIDPQVVPTFLLWWSLFIALTTLTAPIYLARTKYRIPLSSTILLPFYWFTIGLLTIYAIFSPRISWYRTSRRADFPYT